MSNMNYAANADEVVSRGLTTDPEKALSFHTQGKLKWHAQGDANEYCLVTNDDRWVISFRQNGELYTKEQEENARRIVACWNACAGIRTEVLEQKDHLLTKKDNLIANASDQNTHIRLVLEVSYEANGVPVDVLADMLEQMVTRNIGDGGLTGSLDAVVEEWKVTATTVSPEAQALDEDLVADWIASQVESGNVSPEDIPQLMARYALEDSAQMREELAERMGLFEPVTE